MPTTAFIRSSSVTNAIHLGKKSAKPSLLKITVYCEQAKARILKTE